jgi:hypothetical protein
MVEEASVQTGVGPQYSKNKTNLCLFNNKTV